MIVLTILIIENIFLTLFFLIWINRYCSKCQKVKCLERAFNKTCRPCQGNGNKNKKSAYENFDKIKL